MCKEYWIIFGQLFKQQYSYIKKKKNFCKWAKDIVDYAKMQRLSLQENMICIKDSDLSKLYLCTMELK